MMIIKLRGGIGVGGGKSTYSLSVVVSKNTESHSIYFKYKCNAVSIVFQPLIQLLLGSC